MNPLTRTRIEKAAADCGFDLTPYDDDGWIVLRSSAFPESVSVATDVEKGFVIATESTQLLDDAAKHRGYVAAIDIHALYLCLAKAAATARNLPNRIAQQFIQQTQSLPQTTEVERLVVQRIGQDLFRKSLLDYWGGRCCVTGLAVPELLRASHIRPWAKCETNEQRLDVFNGLLLSPNMDALFDGGWITFSDSGEIILSVALSGEVRQLLGVTPGSYAHGLCSKHRTYLSFHRSHVFRAY